MEVIVQAEDMATAAALVRQLSGTVTHELGIIDAVGARMTAAHLTALSKSDGVVLYEKRRVQASGKPAPNTFYPSLVDAGRLHSDGINGDDLTVAVLDTGTVSLAALNKTPDKTWRMLAQ